MYFHNIAFYTWKIFRSKDIVLAKKFEKLLHRIYRNWLRSNCIWIIILNFFCKVYIVNLSLPPKNYRDYYFFLYTCISKMTCRKLDGDFLFISLTWPPENMGDFLFVYLRWPPENIGDFFFVNLRWPPENMENFCLYI